MKKPPRTERRGGQWQYRRRVPTALVSVLGFTEYRESLHTPDMDMARIRAAIRDAEVTVELKAAAEQLKKQQGDIKAPLRLTPEALSYIRDAVKAHILQIDEDFRRSHPNEDTLFEYQSVLGGDYQSTGEALASGRVPTSPDELGRVGDALKAVGIPLLPLDTEWAEAVRRATEGYNAALAAVFRRSSGDYIPTPEAPILPSLTGAQPDSVGTSTLGGVIDIYLTTIKQSGYTRKVKRCLQLFGEVIGRDTPVGELKQKAVTGFLRDICKLPSNWANHFDRGTSVATLMNAAMVDGEGEHEELMSPTTYRDNYRAPLGAFFAEAHRDHGDDGFPALTVARVEYVGTRKANEDQQRALTEPELKELLEGPQFEAIAKDPDQASLYWFTVLSLFTGARPRELCQVNPQVDFGKHEGHPFIDLSPHTAAGKGITKTIKTGEERRIPLHPELVRLGFPEYVERVKKQGADRLFPTWRVKSGNPFLAAGDDFTRLLKDVGLYDDAPTAGLSQPGKAILGAYVMRKTFITLCRNQRIISKEITGHSDGTTTRIQDASYIFGPEPFASKLGELVRYQLPVKVPQCSTQR